MELMRHKRTGRFAVYDESVVAGGQWEAHQPETPKPEPVKALKSKPVPKQVEKTVVEPQRSDDESIERQA